MKYSFVLERELIATVEVEAGSLSDAAEIIASSIEAGEDAGWGFEDVGRYEVFERESGERVLSVEDPESVLRTYQIQGSASSRLAM